MRSSLLVQVVRCRGRINCMTDKAWSVLMPVKVLAEAKSRLAGLAGLTGPRRAALALALASDAAAVVLGSDAVARGIVISHDQAPRAAPSNSAWTASPGCAGTWTRRPTCAARPRSAWGRTARRSPPNCSDVHHGAGERPGDPGHRLDVRGDKTAQLVDVGGLGAHD